MHCSLRTGEGESKCPLELEFEHPDYLSWKKDPSKSSCMKALLTLVLGCAALPQTAPGCCVAISHRPFAMCSLDAATLLGEIREFNKMGSHSGPQWDHKHV